MKIFLNLAMVILVGAGCWFAGFSSASLQASRDANGAALFWLTVIEREFQSGNQEKARELTQTATDATLIVLDALSSEHSLQIGWHILTMEKLDGYHRDVAVSAREILEPRLEELSPEARNYLEVVGP